jgi:nucleotide-binding universal stress UspA family protein
LFRNILAGTDGSDTARVAVVHAVDLAARLEADLTVVSVYRQPSGEAIARALLRDVEHAHRGRVACSPAPYRATPRRR